jgi:hypothetical protein
MEHLTFLNLKLGTRVENGLGRVGVKLMVFDEGPIKIGNWYRLYESPSLPAAQMAF